MNKRSVKCAIYTRKSSEEGLDQTFNSLEAQREACQAYIVSQKHEGWTMLAKHYDDGGYSGGSMDRPALKALLDDIKAEKINTIIVYKVDRLTRSLADFAKIVEILDERGVSFVSVTQQFNTTSSMGRLTLNVLLSFAQFEREITGERIRDKIAASKRKGIWMGGVVPLGYDPVDRRLVINQNEARQVRSIFRKYLQVRCVTKLKNFLDERNIRSKVRAGRLGKTYGGAPYSRGALYHLLNNRIYIGEIIHRSQFFPGQHEAIVSRRLWIRVANQLKDNNQSNRSAAACSTPSLLMGKLFDSSGVRFTPTHTVKNGMRYRYYTSQTVVKGKGIKPPVARFPAQQLETVVISRVHRFLEAPEEYSDEIKNAFDVDRICTGAKALAKEWPKLQVSRQNEFVRKILKRVSVGKRQIWIEIESSILIATLLGEESKRQQPAPGESAVLRVTEDIEILRRGGEVRITGPHDVGVEGRPLPSIVKGNLPNRGDARLSLRCGALSRPTCKRERECFSQRGTESSQ
jgi:site-specific DNA recombinase